MGFIFFHIFSSKVSLSKTLHNAYKKDFRQAYIKNEWKNIRSELSSSSNELHHFVAIQIYKIRIVTY